MEQRGVDIHLDTRRPSNRAPYWRSKPYKKRVDFSVVEFRGMVAALEFDRKVKVWVTDRQTDHRS
jgi:hypothetical protein